ncbi:MAG: aminodeoxychorismate synthase component I, partial [Thermoguttaceae bacterium]
TGRSYLSILGRGENEKAAREQAEMQRKQMLARISGFEADKNYPHPNPHPNGEGAFCYELPKGEGISCYEPSKRMEVFSAGQNCPGSDEDSGFRLHSQISQSEYCRAVETIKERISAGDVYQVCLTRRLDTPLAGGTAWDLYQTLRRINPAPFACFLNFPEVQIVSSSPERFLKLDSDNVAESRPIKGTRPRGLNAVDDDCLRKELAASTKDRAENVMIVDLVRNDFGRVCAFGTVEVPEFLVVEDYATVFQLVSTIRGRLAQGRDGLDLLRACFPGGSMTGAPKIEAMKIIDRLEPVKRGIYSGAIGYIDFSGAMDWSIVIRTIVIANGRCYFHVGGGIVADSEAESEYRETEDKALALITAPRNLQRRGWQ